MTKQYWLYCIFGRHADQDSLSVTIPPRYFPLSTYSSIWPLSEYDLVNVFELGSSGDSHYIALRIIKVHAPIIVKNSKGARTVPCGMPDSICCYCCCFSYVRVYIVITFINILTTFNIN